jgi:DNA-binding Xre family transcriptional regulator
MIKNDHERSRSRLRLNHLSRLRKHLEQLTKNWSMSEPELFEFLENRIGCLNQELLQYESPDCQIEFDAKSDIFRFLEDLDQTGSYLIKARLSLGWSQADLAEKSGIDPRQISIYERGEYKTVSLKNAKRVAAALASENRTRETGSKNEKRQSATTPP